MDDAPGMNFELPEELRMLKDSVRRFVDKELIPIERTACDGHKLKPEMRRHLEAKARELGLANYDVPQEYGGLGLGLLAKVVVWAEMARSIALPSRASEIFGPNVSPILYHLDDEQKRRFLLPTIRGEMKWCFAQTEPDAGGDPGSMRSTAVREGDHYVITGMKRFITGADEADWGQVFAATDRAKGSRGGISAFIVDMKSPGVKLLRAQQTMMDDRPWEIAFEGVKVPVENRIGAEGDGFKFAMAGLDGGRINIASCSLGGAGFALETAKAYLENRKQFGRALKEFQGLQWRLADMATELEAARLMVRRAAHALDQKSPKATQYCAMAKRFATDAGFEIANQALQLHGGYGYLQDFPLERIVRDLRVHQILEGTNEIMRVITARELFRQ
jgi:acyl-CoA dehydrogenase